MIRDSDSPSSSLPSSRWTTTLIRDARWRASSGKPAGVAVLTSLMTLEPRGMLAPAHPSSLSLNRRVASAETLRRPAPVKHPLRSRHALRDALDLGGSGCHRGRAAVAARFDDHDPDRHRHERRAKHAAAAFFGLDPASVSVGWVVERGNRLIESFGDLRGDRLSHAGLGQDHEVVAADVAREMLRRVVLLQDFEHDGGEGLVHVVAAQEAVVVVVALEGIDVGVEDREALVLDEPAADLSQ